MKKVIVGLLACGAVACGDLEGGEITLDEATAESTLEQTPSEVPSELDAASEAEETAFSGLQEADGSPPEVDCWGALIQWRWKTGCGRACGPSREP